MLLGYDVVNLGEWDFVYGARFLLEMRNKYQIPFVSANVYDVESGKPFVEPYLIKRLDDKKSLGSNFGELKVGIFGLTMKNPRLTRADRTNKGRHLAAQDPIESARSVMKILKKEADLIICLAHIGPQQARTLAKEVPGIDVIIVGHGGRRQGTPLLVGETRIVQAGNKGQYVGDLTLYLDEDRKIIGHKGILAPLDASYKDDPKLASLVAEYKTKVSKIKRSKSTQ